MHPQIYQFLAEEHARNLRREAEAAGLAAFARQATQAAARGREDRVGSAFMALSRMSVKRHASAVLAKLGASRRAEVAREMLS